MWWCIKLKKKKKFLLTSRELHLLSLEPSVFSISRGWWVHTVLQTCHPRHFKEMCPEKFQAMKKLWYLTKISSNGTWSKFYFLNISDISKHLFSIYYPSRLVILFSPPKTCLHAQYSQVQLFQTLKMGWRQTWVYTHLLIWANTNFVAFSQLLKTNMWELMSLIITTGI